MRTREEIEKEIKYNESNKPLGPLPSQKLGYIDENTRIIIELLLDIRQLLINKSR